MMLPSCMPTTPKVKPAEKNKKEVTQKKHGQSDSKKTTKSKKEKVEDNPEELALKSYNENVKRLAESAVSKSANKKINNKNNAADKNPFAKKQEKLKDVSHEDERFVDTTYYMIKMENEQTEIITNAIIAGGKTADYFEKLIKEFDVDVKRYENMSMYDCSNFLRYSNQFSFNDSLKQKALYHYADCCLGNDMLNEATETLEKMLKDKLHKSIEPLTLLKLGQVYCLKSEKNKAEKVFKRLKKEYPRSPLLQSADCSRM